MIIDSLTDKSVINIDKLTIPDVKTESFPTFVPGKELTDVHWDKGLELLRSLHNSLTKVRLRPLAPNPKRGIADFRTLVVPLKFFFPERAQNLPLDRSIFFQYEDDADGSILDISKLEAAAEVKYLFPAIFSEFPFRDNAANRMAVRSWIESARENEDLDYFIRVVVAAKKFFSGDLKIPPLTDGEWDALSDYLNERLTWGRIGLTEYMWGATQARLAWPERARDLVIDESCWKRMRQQLTLWEKSGSWVNFFSTAYFMAILAADEVKITPDGGIAVKMNKLNSEMQEKIPDMPVKRAF